MAPDRGAVDEVAVTGEPGDIGVALMIRAADRTNLQRGALAAKLGVSRRTLTRWLSKEASPSGEQLAELTRLVHEAGATDVAHELATACGQTLAGLGIERPLPPPPALGPDRTSAFVDAIVCVAADVMSVPPSAMRASLLAAFERTVALELTAEDVALALRPVQTPKRASERRATGPSRGSRRAR